MGAEIWKDIEGFEGFYCISSLGNVFSIRLDRNMSVKSNRYPKVTLCKNNTKTTASVHRLVAEAFLPNLYNKPMVNHLDGDKTFNAVSNLEWATCSENNAHSVLLHNKGGENCHLSKLTTKDVVSIREKNKRFRERLCRKYEVTNANLSSILNIKTWKQDEV